MSDVEQKDSESSDPQIEGGAYELIRRRLVEQGDELGAKSDALNVNRVEVFGGIEMSVLGQQRMRTENNCVPRDIVTVHGKLIFGYNVFIGLKKETSVDDVLSMHRLLGDGEEMDFHAVDDDENFLRDEKFNRDFQELYQYYKSSKLIQLRVRAGKLLAVFQVGERVSDVKVFRWAIETEASAGRGGLTYLDNRGERDHVFPAAHDFEWVETTRDEFVLGRHPHVNILDEVFVETVGGDLTVKIEDNSDDGQGIYREDVDDKNQSLADGKIHYAKLGGLILLKILPYREETWRYLVFNTRTKDVQRIDAIGQSCVQLPEDHGIIFPGGYYLQSGETKSFDADAVGLRFSRQIRSPNGEDVLFIFYRQDDGVSTLLPYNLIRKEVDKPIRCNGSSLFDDGKLVIFRADEDPTRVHHMQVWQTAYVSDEVAARLDETSEHAGSFLTKVGNPDLVRGISDCSSIQRAIRNQKPSMAIYEDLIKTCTRVLDQYHWLANAGVGDLAATLHEVQKTAELVIDEFEKVLGMQANAREALAEAKKNQEEVLLDLRPETWKTVDHFVEAMAKLRTQRGHLITLKEMRYIDLAFLEELEKEVQERFEYLSDKATEFLTGDDALSAYHVKNEGMAAAIEAMTQAREADPINDDIDRMAEGLDLLTEVVGTLQIDDANARTRILEDISSIFALVNRTRASLVMKRKALLSQEGVAEFGAQFKLFGQSVQSALGLCDTPERCDEQLTRLMVQLEELEGRFSEFDEFIGDLAQKREEVYETLSNKKQQLLEERQRRAQNLANAAERILQGIGRRANTFKELDALNAYFAADAMVIKVKDLAEKLMELGDTVRAEDVQGRIKRAREDAIRQLRDKNDLFGEDGENVIRFGKHGFTVNTQPLDLTLLPKNGGLALHLTGTDYYEILDEEHSFGPRLEEVRDYWNQSLISETAEVSRAEHLAASILFSAEQHEGEHTLEDLQKAALDKGPGDDESKALLDLVKQVAGERYDEGYDRGVHDSDAALLLDKLLALYSTAGLLRFSPYSRAISCLYWAFSDDEETKKRLRQKAQSLGRLQDSMGPSKSWKTFHLEVQISIAAFFEKETLDVDEGQLPLAAAYLAEELRNAELQFVTSSEAENLLHLFYEHLDAKNIRAAFDDDIRALSGDLKSQLEVVEAWLEAFIADHMGDEPETQKARHLQSARLESAVLVVTQLNLQRISSSSLSSVDVTGLLGLHANNKNGKMVLRLDEFLVRLRKHFDDDVPAFQSFRMLRTELLEDAREKMRLDEFKPRVLSSFVRNKLINDVYLPLIGDNLAKQMGATGAKKRTDLMGLLLLISPPGYGKTTLMEYVASRLGLTFMKVNGPSIGHDVVSLDPSEAPNATARQEVEKINLAFEMGNNVMLYLDDIQHTHPELLQKFISLCDGSRRVEGVWQGKTRTYDLRGKKFCIVMAGNPYTESGDRFQIPDMLSNRADTYNLGDILGGQEETFALSYVENSLTSNPVLQPLATREASDIYLFVRMAKGEEIPTSELAHGYSAIEVNEIVNVMGKLLVCQDVLLKVNAEYIRSASMEDKYRTEPAFKLQGSYRNMNKLAEKVVAVMNDDELEQVIEDHYGQESQTLTTGAEQNLLKLADMRGTATKEQQQRWQEIKDSFSKNQMMGGDDADPISRVTSTLAALAGNVADISDVVQVSQTKADTQQAQVLKTLEEVPAELSQLRKGVLAQGKASRIFDDQRLQNDLQQSQKLGEVLQERLGQLQQTLAQAAQHSAKSTHEALLQSQQNLSPLLQAMKQTKDTLENTQLHVQVQMPSTSIVDDTLKLQSQLMQGTLLPLLQTLQAIGQHLAKTPPPSPLDQGMKDALEMLSALEHKLDSGVIVGQPIISTSSASPAAGIAPLTATAQPGNTKKASTSPTSSTSPASLKEEVYRPFKPRTPKGTRAS